MKTCRNYLTAPVFSAVRKHWLLLMAATCSLAFASAAATAAPKVAASIKPLQLIAAAITDGVSEAQLVLGNGQDPHHASLRPSDRRALAAADIVLWVGPILELPLVESIAGMGSKGLAVQEMPAVVLHEIDGHLDPHVWLDTRNARNIATHLAQVLVQRDPGNSQRYETNLDKFTAALDQLDAAVARDLSPLQSQPWTVYHNAFRYFVAEFALTEPLAPTENANNEAGIRSIVTLRENIQRQKITCMLTEPDLNHAELHTLLDAPDLNIVTADILGYELAATADAYPLLMQNFARALVGCLQGPSR